MDPIPMWPKQWHVITRGDYWALRRQYFAKAPIFFSEWGEILRDGSAYRFILIAHRFIYRSLKFDIDTHGNPQTSSFGVSVSDHMFSFWRQKASKVYEAYSCHLKRPKEGLRQAISRMFLADTFWRTDQPLQISEKSPTNPINNYLAGN